MLVFRSVRELVSYRAVRGLAFPQALVVFQYQRTHASLYSRVTRLQTNRISSCQIRWALAAPLPFVRSVGLRSLGR